MEEVEIPSYYLCPISLEIMRDPVTLPTGITFDRDSIEKWLFSDQKNRTCPVTKQPLPDSDICTPNHTLLRLIQAWCVANAASGVHRIPTPRAPIDRNQISKLLQEAKQSTANHLPFLQKLQQIISCGEASRRCIEASEAVDFLASLVEDYSETRECDEALAVLHSLRISEQRLRSLITSRTGLIGSLFAALRLWSYRSRSYAAVLLKSTISLVSPIGLASLEEEQLHDVVEIIRDWVSNQATKAALQVLIELFSWGRNRVKAVNAGAVHVLVNLLLEDREKRECELALVALDKLCACAEGRAELVGHAAGVAVVSKKILRVSGVASERAVRIVEKVSKLSATPALLQEMMEVGVVSKLCFLLQVEYSGEREKERARAILSLHARIWKKSTCLPPQFLSSCPSS
ncbi:E3 ubiquitin-protein ligase PUB23 [Platanthera zijinensis]|uniref:U-box domain-containing protein n=1 Tax=Platanthera zijinensis TaxID=2320716 RepID=A0AAP0B4N9_9ASPA